MISKDDNGGDGSKVAIKEEHGVFLGPLLGRMNMSSSDNNEGGSSSSTKDVHSTSTAKSMPMISFALDKHTSEKLQQSESSPGIQVVKSNRTNNKHTSHDFGDTSIEYDNLVVQMGLVKCGHRYRACIDVPDYWKPKNNGDCDSNTNKQDQGQGGGGASTAVAKEDQAQSSIAPSNNDESSSSYSIDVRIAEDSLDDDLKGEIQTSNNQPGATASNDASSSLASLSRKYSYYHQVHITLSARRRGPYRGRFVLELKRIEQQLSKQSSLFESKKNNGEGTVDTPNNNNSTPKRTDPTTTIATTPTSPTCEKCLMSLQVDATIMGEDMGTPKLRNGVVCLGKMVGYDSDDETEWRGFD